MRIIMTVDGKVVQICNAHHPGDSGLPNSDVTIHRYEMSFLEEMDLILDPSENERLPS